MEMALGTEGKELRGGGSRDSALVDGDRLHIAHDVRPPAPRDSQGQLITAAAMLDDVFSLVLLAMLRGGWKELGFPQGPILNIGHPISYIRGHLNG